MDDLALATEFSQITSCSRCDKVICRKILRDNEENVPQPGFIGQRFVEKRLLLVGQNPGVPNDRLAIDDRNYTAALRKVRDQISSESFLQLQKVLLNFVPSWPVHGNYFPLLESGLTLDEIAYCNLVRCRTEGNAQPSSRMVSQCATTHFQRWLDILQPRAIVFIGKWAHDRGACFAETRGIPVTFMNRERSLSAPARLENRQQVAAFVRNITE